LESTEYADYSYNACGDLEHVTRPMVNLGFDKYGNTLTGSATPQVSYTYEAASSCPVATHYLTSVSTNQMDAYSGPS